MPISASLRRALESSRGAIQTTANDPNKPDYESQSYLRQLEDVLLCRAVYEGTKTVRAAGEDLLPQYPSEDDEDYRRRLKRAVLFNAYRRTVGGLTGMVFRKDPNFVELPDARTAAELLNVDLLGHDLSTYARGLMADAMIDGHTWVVVDFPRVDGVPIRSAADERALGIRPYWCQVLKQDAINPQWTVGANGRPELSLFAYKTTEMRRGEGYGEEVVELVRVLTPGAYEEHERTKDGWRQVAEGTTSLPYIPVSFVPTNETKPFESSPPLLDLAYENIDHYQIRSDHRWASIFASVPMHAFFGVSQQDVQWGANRALFFPDAEAKAQILESSGASLDSTRQDLKDSEARMAALGLQMLVGEKRAAETAQAKMIGKSESDSALATAAKSVQDGLNRALAIHADWTGRNVVEVQLNEAFHENPLDASAVTAISNLVAKGQLSLETMWSILEHAGTLPDSFDPEEERERIDGGALDLMVEP